ncbi:MAG: MBL fold metallo-hydrolase [Candidatus Latescibacterota bacterium]|nr:MBL fold metallo-hydrolase [Candidatus Latescibacterota bacterium]
MQITFRGVRGSYPVAAPHSVRYGGNTPCIEVWAGETCLIIDAGTGIRPLGKKLIEQDQREIHLLISHTHWDHVQGFPHFDPQHNENAHIRIYSLTHPDRSLCEIFRTQQQAPFYPVSIDAVEAQIEFLELTDGQPFQIGGAQISCHRLNHPGVTGGYRIEYGGKVLSYISDVDLYGPILLGNGMENGSQEEQRTWHKYLQNSARDLAHRADLMICDTFFLPDEYQPDWGHSRPEDAVHLGAEAQVQSLALFHHEPHRSDEEMDAIQERYREEAPCDLFAAVEGMELSL